MKKFLLIFAKWFLNILPLITIKAENKLQDAINKIDVEKDKIK